MELRTQFLREPACLLHELPVGLKPVAERDDSSSKTTAEEDVEDLGQEDQASNKSTANGSEEDYGRLLLTL